MKQNRFAFTKEENEKNIREISKWYEEVKDRKVEDMADFFTSRADSYDKHMENVYRDYHIFPKLLPKDTKTLLDLGCGTGLEMDEIFKANPSLKATGIDIAQGMLDILFEKYADKDINLICADYLEYDFGKNNYDAVISVQSFHHFSDDPKSNLYKKIYKTLKIGGVFIEADYTASSKEHEKLCIEFYKSQREKFNVSNDEFVHIDIPMTIKHREKLILEARFSRIEVVHKARNTVTMLVYK